MPSAPVESKRPSPPSPLRVVGRAGAEDQRASSADELVRLGPDGRLELALADHARLTIDGPALIALAPGGAPALLVREGVVTVDCAAPLGATTDVALWIATPTGRIEIAQRARFALLVERQASVLSVVSGDVRVRQGEATQGVAAGGTRCLGGRTISALRAPGGKLERRGEQLRRLPACPRSPDDPSDAQVGDELRSRVAALSEARARARDTAAEHARLSASDPKAAASRQRALAEQSAATLRLGDEVRARRSVLAARTLGAAPAALLTILEQADRAAP